MGMRFIFLFFLIICLITPFCRGDEETCIEVTDDGLFKLPMSFLPADFASAITNSRIPAKTNWDFQYSRKLPLVVTVIPSLKRHHFLCQSLEYIRRQMYPRLAVVILDEDFIPISEDHRKIGDLMPSQIFTQKTLELENMGIPVFYEFILWNKERCINVGEKRNRVMDLVKRKEDQIGTNCQKKRKTMQKMRKCAKCEP